MTPGGPLAHRPWPALIGSGLRTGASLTGASAAWLVSGLSPSPLINSLLPALSAGTALLPLPGSARAGLSLQLAGVLLLLSTALRLTGTSPGWPLLAVLLIGLGATASLLPLQSWLLEPTRLSLTQLRLLADGGSVAGSLLTAVLFPLTHSLVPQFLIAALLHVPALGLVWGAGWGRVVQAAPVGRAAPSTTTRGAAAPTGRTLRFHLGSCLQSLLFGALFALLPLWVRTISRGTCVDFGMALTAYGLGRPMATLLPMPAGLRYLGMSLLLLLTSWLPGWGAVAVFLPLGALAAGSDAALADSVPGANAALRLQVFERSSALGGLLGSLAMGLLSQRLGLESARAAIVAAFLVAALLLPRRR